MKEARSVAGFGLPAWAGIQWVTWHCHRMDTGMQ